VREGDTLWDIAREHLGDGLTWPRIYSLNNDRVQDDGASLTDPDLIKPGWRLAIPTAHGTPAPPPPLRAPETTPGPPVQHPTGEHAHDDDSAAAEPTSDAEGKPRPRADRTTPTSAPATVSLGEAGLIGITLAAGLLAARRYWHFYQRRLRDPESDTDVPELSPLVEKAAQAAHTATQRRTPPDPEALVIRRTPPRPPLPARTVSIGVRDTAEVQLDELATANGCGWTGPGAEDAARALLVGILTAAERQRPGPPQVTAVVTQDLADLLLPGLPVQFSALTQSADTAQAIQTAELRLLAQARAHAQHENDATNDLNEPPAAPGPGTLLLLTAPEAVHTGQLQALAARNHPDTLIVLTLKTSLPGAERWHITSDGTTRPAPSGHHTEPLRLFHLTPEAGRDMTDVLLTAHGRSPRPRVLPIPGPTPSPATRREPAQPEPDPTPDEDAPDHPVEPETPAPSRGKPVRLHVLGPITLYARGNPDPIGTQLRSEVHEFLALLAAHPTGLLAADIAEKLHLDPAKDQNALKNLRRAVRRALRAATGITAQEFILRQGELHKLNPQLVETDLSKFTVALKQAFHLTGTGSSSDRAIPAVQEALSHYRGPFAHGSDYVWVDTVREHLAVKATDAAIRLARAAEAPDAPSGDRDAVLALLEHLAQAHPDHERLAQHAIRLYQAAGRHDAARHTYTRLERALADLGLVPEPPTKSLVSPRTAAPRTTSSR
jgi:DNA-binding SARP family transcriptional activator